MDTKELDKRIKRIRKYYRKNKLLLELQFILYEGFNIYIRLDYIKKLNTYRLSWFNLDVVDNIFIERTMSFECVSEQSVKNLFKDIDTYKAYKEKNKKVDSDKVILSLFDNKKTYTYEFYKYIPKEIAFLSVIFINIFNNLPSKLQWILYKLHTEIEESITSYEYTKEFSFDLFKDDIDMIFAKQIVKRGKKYYEEDKIKYLEKIDDDRYFSIVEGNEKYLVVVKYDKKNKKVQVYCSCPCEFYCKHIYAVVVAIRNKKFKKFYKIIYRNPDISMIERIMNADYQLCLGIVDNNFEIINSEGDIELVPIFNSEGVCNWKVLEDDEYMTLTKVLQEKIHDYNKK